MKSLTGILTCLEWRTDGRSLKAVLLGPTASSKLHFRLTPPIKRLPLVSSRLSKVCQCLERMYRCPSCTDSSVGGGDYLSRRLISKESQQIESKKDVRESHCRGVTGMGWGRRGYKAVFPDANPECSTLDRICIWEDSFIPSPTPTRDWKVGLVADGNLSRKVRGMALE